MLALILLFCPTAIAIESQVQIAPTEKNVRTMLASMGCGVGLYRQWLLDYGSSAFPVYEKILTDPKSKPVDVGRSLGILSSVGGDRTRFVRLAAHHLTSDNAGVRYQAAMLVGQIGSSNEGIILVALLSDRDLAVVTAAAQALAATGGPRELAAMDVWLKTADHRNRELHLHVVKQREAFQKRLDAEAKKLRDGG